jgi:predicted NAD/FAD-binding protein
MPKKSINWSSWNFRYEKSDDFKSSTIYYMNQLQNLPEEIPYFVSINSPEIINSKLIHKKMNYDHPIFDLKSIEAQKRIPSLNQNGPLYFAGSYQRFGFHEDALWSALQVCLHLTGKAKIEDLLC